MVKRQLKGRGTEEDRKRQYKEPSNLTEPDNKDATDTANSAHAHKKTRLIQDTLHDQLAAIPPLEPLGELNDSDSEKLLKDCLGFSRFSSTQGLHVFGNQDGHLPPRRKQRQYRQMLHVRGIYNIPLTRQQQIEKSALKEHQQKNPM